MPFVRGKEAPEFEVPGVKFTALAAPSRGSVENSVWRFVVEPGAKGQPHKVTREETFIALSGTVQILIFGVLHEFCAGDALVVPPLTEISLANFGSEEFHGVAVLPVGGKVIVAGAEPFTPPWAA